MCARNRWSCHLVIWSFRRLSWSIKYRPQMLVSFSAEQVDHRDHFEPFVLLRHLNVLYQAVPNGSMRGSSEASQRTGPATSSCLLWRSEGCKTAISANCSLRQCIQGL